MYRHYCVKAAILCCVVVLFGCEDQVRDVGSGSKEKLKKVNDKLTKTFAEILKVEVKDGLKDPESAQLKNIAHYGAYTTFMDGTRIQLSNHTICGEVNSKNFYGGYVGFRPFFRI